MQLPLSHAVAEHLDVVPQAGSTNVELVARASGAPHLTVLATTDQTAGKGRLGRVWVAPPGKTIAVSVLLRPNVQDADRLGWLPLLAGLAMTRAVASLVPGRLVGLKWPNDVQVDGLKISGLLAEYVPAESAVVIGAGLNLTMTEEELPTPVSTSLTLQGAVDDGIVDAALSAYLRELFGAYRRFALAGFDAQAGLRREVSEACTSIGRSVRVELPGGGIVEGIAVSIDELGRLVVRGGDGVETAVAAGDVTHARFDPGA